VYASLPVLEMLVLADENGVPLQPTTLPTGFVAPGMLFPPNIFLGGINDAAHVVVEGTPVIPAVTLKTVLAQGDLIYKGYIDSPFNTDNAWLETVVINFHDPAGTVFTADTPLVLPGVNVAWVDLSADLDLPRSEAEFLSTCAAKHNAFYVDKIPLVVQVTYLLA
jgi:hypothetical protein